MNKKDMKVIDDFKKRLSLETIKHIKKIIIFGSRVYGDAPEDSDLDIAVLVDEKCFALVENLEEIVYNVMWDNDFNPVISLKVFDESDFYNAVEKGFSFYKNVLKKGIPV